MVQTFLEQKGTIQYLHVQNDGTRAEDMDMLLNVTIGNYLVESGWEFMEIVEQDGIYYDLYARNITESCN